MDARQTIEINESFSEMLQSLYKSGNKVYLLVDDNGITRAEGFIKTFNTTTDKPSIELDNGIKVTIETIIAVNGVFRADYSEC
jgi:hypothetical protein